MNVHLEKCLMLLAPVVLFVGLYAASTVYSHDAVKGSQYAQQTFNQAVVNMI